MTDESFYFHSDAVPSANRKKLLAHAKSVRFVRENYPTIIENVRRYATNAALRIGLDSSADAEGV